MFKNILRKLNRRRTSADKRVSRSGDHKVTEAALRKISGGFIWDIQPKK